MGTSKVQTKCRTIQPAKTPNTINHNMDTPFVASSQQYQHQQAQPENENEQSSDDNNNIGHFYTGTTVFITGATGFVGKALLEKLLRSCDGILAIYIMVRPKRGMSVEQRLKELIKNPVFDRVREKKPEYFDKIRVMSGDVTQPNFGLSDADRQILINNVNIAFHSAATVRFNENLKDAVILNTGGTTRFMKLCKEMKKLKSVVHVSTAYSNADKREIEEIVYPPPHDPKTVMHCVDSLPPDALNQLTDKLLGKHPNTYTLTKAMAEHIVLESSSDLPIAIVRPSIVTAAWKEPFPGWVDNISGITGIMMEIGRGTIRSIICNEKYLVDVIPVDIVTKTLVTAAWHNAVHRSNTVRVYNCTSGQVNGISWHNFGRLTEQYAIEYPSKYISWYPGFKFRTNRLVHFFCHWFLHVIPACMLDIMLYCTKHKPIMLRICKKFSRASRAGEFFALNEFHFANGQLKNLMEAVNKAEDGEDFCADMSKTSDFSWDSYVQHYMLGIRQYVLKDDESSLVDARSKLQKLYWAYKMVQFASAYMVLRYTLR